MIAPRFGAETIADGLLKAAGNMAGKLLAVDESLRKKDIAVVNVHVSYRSVNKKESRADLDAPQPGFMRTEMTASIGYDKYWDEGGAVEPAVAAQSLLDFGETVSREQNGQFWAPRGPRSVEEGGACFGARLLTPFAMHRDIGEAERVLGKDLPTPLQLPY